MAFLHGFLGDKDKKQSDAALMDDKEKIQRATAVMNENEKIKSGESNNEVLKEDSQEAENTDYEVREDMAKMAYQAKRRYLYIAFDTEGYVILNEKNEPYFRIAEEGALPDWSPELGNDVKTDPEFRVKIAEINNKLSKRDRNKAKTEVREKAVEELKALAADIIQRSVNRKLGDKTMKDERNSFSGPEFKSEEKSFDFSSVISAVKEAEDNLNRDFVELIDDLHDVIGKSGLRIANEIKRCTRDETEFILEKFKEDGDNSVRNTVRPVVDRIQKASENVIGRVNDASRSLKEGQEKIISKTTSVDKRVDDIRESVESIEGNLRRLDQLDDIVELLQNKGLVISMDIPPVNADEEDIINLVRYSQKITEQLGYAARDLIRKQAVFRNQAQSNANEQSMMEQKVAAAYEDGVKDGKRIFVKQLISKYADIDAIKESKDGHVHAIWALLEEIGAEIDGDGAFRKYREVTISAEDADRMAGTYNGITDGGRYKVLKTGLVYAGEIVYKAEFEKVQGEREKSQEEKQEPEN